MMKEPVIALDADPADPEDRPVSEADLERALLERRRRRQDQDRKKED